jgi:hypothetical protein
MGLFDRFTRQPEPAAVPSPAAPANEEKKAAAVAGGVLPQLAAAKAKLAAKDLPGALAIYEEVLASAGDRPDVLLTASGDLGTHGHVRELVELVAPRYDAKRHGPGPGVNLLQAYLAMRDLESAQHVLDLLFSLGRPELEERLIGFSRAIAELSASDAAAPELPREAAQISLVSLSKPVWFYGLEAHADRLFPAKGGKLRRVAFAQCSLPGEPGALEKAAQPEDALGRFSRGWALWLAETFAASVGYEAFAGIGAVAPRHYALFPVDWTAENVRQLVDSTEGGLDYVVTSSLRARHGDFELTVRVWEVRKSRELKAFTARWTPATADRELAAFHAQLRNYMEWSALPAGLGVAYAPPASPEAHIHALGASLGLFLLEKGVIAADHAPGDASLLLASARANPDDVRAQLALLSGVLRLRARGLEPDAATVRHVREWLATEAAGAADVSALILRFA